jgi:hypothetical protein
MSRRHLALPPVIAAVIAAVIATVIAAGSWVAPAYAASGTVISNVATPTAGQVTGTVTSDAAFIQVSLTGTPDDAPITGDVQAVPSDTHSVDFSLSTWGLPDSAVVSVATCNTVDASTCGAAAATQTFSPQDVAPTVTWPSTTQLGQVNSPYTLTVSDDGGGILQAKWDPPNIYETGVTYLAHHGATNLDLPDGSLDITVQRCQTPGGPCRSFPGLTAHVDVHRQFGGRVEVTPQFVGPDATTAPDIQAHIYVGSGTNLTVHLTVTRVSNGVVVSGFGGTVSGLELDGDGYLTVPVDLTGLSSGTYDLGGTIEYDDPDFGHLQGPLSAGSFAVDSSKPVIQSVKVTWGTIYPARDGYRDAADITTTATDDHYWSTKHEIVNSHGTVVRTLSADFGIGLVAWNGRTKGGAMVPAGRYTIRTVVTDEYGNASAPHTMSVTVSHKRLVNETFTKTVSAKGTLARKYVGRCSTLKFPSDRGWKGSMGLYTATKCKGSLKRTLVSTVHVLRVPDAFKYGRLSVSAYGGAAKANPRSLAYISYAHKKKGWQKDKALGTKLGTHSGAHVGAAGYIWPDRSIAWGVYTAMGAKYDVKGFTVHLTYTVLR